MQSFNDSITIAAPASRVVELITTETYLRLRYEEPQVQSFDLDITEDSDSAFAYQLRRNIATGDKVPRMARKIVGDTIKVVQTQRWDRVTPPFNAEMTVEAEGLPGAIGARTQLIDIDGNSCRLEVTGSVTVDIPLVGGQLEKLLAGKISDSLNQSSEAIRDYVVKNV